MTKLDMAPIVEVFSEIANDMTVPKNVRNKFGELLKAFDNDRDFSITLTKVLDEIEEILDDVNIEPYTRTQMWSAISLLEDVKKQNMCVL